ncbi:hypothetical protein QUF90_08985 [Desulfococcaceae bacterium HSG9]|nr:hypothetical protein [Desulfococcaceae bacterium HSG9]
MTYLATDTLIDNWPDNIIRRKNIYKKLSIHLFIVAFAMLAIISGSEAFASADYLYVTNDGNNTVTRMNLDDTTLVVNLNLDGLLNNPKGIALDAAGGKMYIANSDSDNIIQANLDGTGGKNLGSLGNTLVTPWAIALDLTKGHMYVVSQKGGEGRVSRANLDGTQGQTLVENLNTLYTPTEAFNPMQIALDVAAGNMYIIVENGNVFRISLDGSNVTVFDSDNAAGGIALAGGKMYITHPNDALDSTNTNLRWVTQSNMDATTGKIDLLRDNFTLRIPYNITLDTDAGYMYVANNGNNTVTRANLLDGGEPKAFDMGGHLNKPFGVALLYYFYSPPPPVPEVINVTSTATSGTYSVGSVIEITIGFSYLVWVKGIPSLALNTGGPVPGHAYYSGGSGTKIITFQYTVAVGDDITKLDYWSQWALELNGGQMYSNEGVDVVLDLPVPGESGSLGNNTTLGILGTLYPLYRFYSPGLLKHLFTADENEKEYILANMADVWKLEDSPYSVFLPWQYNAAAQELKDTLMAVHRFYNAALQTHLYTVDTNETAHLNAGAAETGWGAEGPVFYVPVGNPEGAIPVYRFYNKNLKVHLFTVDENEKTHLIETAGDVWRFEDVAYYAYP